MSEKNETGEDQAVVATRKLGQFFSEAEMTTSDKVGDFYPKAEVTRAIEASQMITHEGVTFDLSKAQDAPQGGIGGLLDGMTVKEVVYGPKKKSGKFGEGTLSFLNRHARRKLEAFEASAKWKRMMRNGDAAAVRKLNREGATVRANWDKYGSPED